MYQYHLARIISIENYFVINFFINLLTHVLFIYKILTELKMISF